LHDDDDDEMTKILMIMFRMVRHHSNDTGEDDEDDDHDDARVRYESDLVSPLVSAFLSTLLFSLTHYFSKHQMVEEEKGSRG